ncbi:c-type cytochrome [Segetibacter koreensis]|uniref:c-type cytochrome n=1 Tax=Segetibacter koreensis TaxID=398037 RepID=UPI000364E2C3|nr:c-type cytochrome [Segetibacter koreensis]
MKKALIILCTLVIAFSGHYYSFSQKQIKKPAARTAAKTVSAKAGSSSSKSNSSKAEIEQGKELISKSDCLACHQLQVKVVGPAYSAVAEKYAATDANINMLSEKIIKGGSGVWGPVAMTPHPSVTAADTKKMVKYILSLKAK